MTQSAGYPTKRLNVAELGLGLRSFIQLYVVAFVNLVSLESRRENHCARKFLSQTVGPLRHFQLPGKVASEMRVKTMGPENQLQETRSIILRIGGSLAEEVYQAVCRFYLLSNRDVDWSRSQHGRIVGLAKRIYSRMVWRASQPRATCFSDLSEFDAHQLPDGRPASLEDSIDCVSIVASALSALQPNHRIALEGYYRGRRESDLARELGVSSGTIRQWRRRDLPRLRALLNKRRPA